MSAFFIQWSFVYRDQVTGIATEEHMEW